MGSGEWFNGDAALHPHSPFPISPLPQSASANTCSRLLRMVGRMAMITSTSEIRSSPALSALVLKQVRYLGSSKPQRYSLKH